MSITNQFLQDRIDATKREIAELETAMNAVVTGATQMYTMNTGQGQVTVTKLNLSVLSRQIDMLLSRLAGYEMRLTGNQIRIARAAW